MSAVRPIRYGSAMVGTLESRIAKMRELVEHGLRDPDIRRLALQIVRGCKARDELCELRAIHEFNQSHLRYGGDIADRDTFQTWRASLDFGSADCDDACIANATAIAHNGFGAVARVTTAGETPEHVYCIALYPKIDPKAGVAMDTTLPNGNLGDEPPQIRRFWDFPLVMP